MTSIDELDPYRFYTPEEIAPYLGIAPSTLRGYCRASRIFTKVGRRMMLDPENARAIHQWVKEHNTPTAEQLEDDPFAV